MASGFQRPPAAGERPEPAPGSGAIGGDVARGYPIRPAISALCQEALDGALELVKADGGELSLLDEAQPRLVTHARRSRRPQVSRPAYGAPSYPSQPLRGDSMPDDPFSPIDDQITQVLPSAQLARVHALGQGLIGEVWKRRETTHKQLKELSLDMRQALLVEQDAAHHLAVPIFHPDRLDHIGGDRRAAVIGVLRVFTRDELWPYSANDARLLELHADRLARALALLEAPGPSVHQDDLAAMLRELSGVSPTQEEIYTRVVEVITRENPALAVCALAPSGETLEVAQAMRAGVRRQGERLALAEAPRAVRRALQGELAVDRVPAADCAALFSRLAWDSSGPLRATLAAPIGASPHTIGALFIGAPSGELFTPELTGRIEATALAAAIFLENARLVQDARQSVLRTDARNRRYRARDEQLAALNNAVMTLNRSLDEAVNLQDLADQSAGVTAAAVKAAAATLETVAAVFVRDEAKRRLVCRAVATATYESESDDVKIEHEKHNSLLGATIPFTWNDIGKRLEQQSYVVDLQSASGDTLPNDGVARLRGAGGVSAQATAIFGQNTPLGALLVFTPGQPAQFAPTETATLDALASQAAVAISNTRLYRQLQEAYERQKELDRLKDDFILTVSHEFRTPLTAIQGYVTLISRHGDKLDQSKLATFAGEIHQATSQLAGMISMLADASRLSDQTLRVTTHAVELTGMAAEAISRQPPEEKQRIQSRIDSALWVAADDERLPLVFTNLISNALKYSGSDKPVRIHTRRVSRADFAAQRHQTLAGEPGPDWVVVSVEDEGPGISAEDQARLFQKFVRLQQSLTTSVRGTGLGLWICRQYVEAMGGEIWVDSRPGQGARFSFTLPLADPTGA